MGADSDHVDKPTQEPQYTSGPRRRAFWLGALLVLVFCARMSDAGLWRPHTTFGFHENVQIGEAQAWWDGRMDLPQRLHDTATSNGRIYSYFPPLFTFIAATVVPFFGGVPHLLLVLLAGVVPLLAYVLFLRLTGSVAWAVAWSIGFVCGTSAWPVIQRSLVTAAPYPVNHVLSTIGILLILIAFFGNRALWPALLGLAMTFWSRQMTLAFAVPVAYMAYRPGAGESNRRRLGVAIAAMGMMVVVYLGLNAMKFGDPLNTGYMLNHEGRDDIFAREARAHGILSAYWIPRNLYYANIGLPEAHKVAVAGQTSWYIRPNIMGTGIWWISPVLLWVILCFREICRDRDRRVLLAGAAAVFALLLLWHATGAEQRGYNRYSLDYLPVLFSVIAPVAVTGRRKWLTLAMLAWALLYFLVLLPMPHWRF